MFGSRVTAARADLEFFVPVDRTRADLAKVQEEYNRTIGQMSTATLRQQTAEERLNRTLATSTVDSHQVARATLAYRREMSALEAESHRSNAALASESRTVERFGRGLLAGTGVLGGFRRAVFFASSSILGGFGLTYAIRSTVDAAEEQQVALGHIETALLNTGKRWDDYRGRIEKALSAQVRSTAFTDNELAESLAAFIRRYGDVDKALQANAIAADVARAKNISLADAQTLVMRASFGNPRSLRILGIELTKTTANYDQLRATLKQATPEQIAAAKAADQQANELAALDAVQAKYHGNAQRFLKTSAGRQALFNAELDRTKELVGAALLPTLDRYLSKGARWLSQEQNQHRIQQDVNEVIRDGAAVVHTLEYALHPLTDSLRVLGKATRGTENEVKLLSGAWLLLYARSKLVKLGLLETAAATSGAVSRVGMYTGTVDRLGTSSAGSAGKVALLTSKLKGLAALGAVVVTVAVIENLIRNAVTGDAGAQLHPFGKNPAAGPVSRPGTIVQYPDGRFYKIGSKASGYNPAPYTPKHGDVYYRSTDDNESDPQRFGRLGLTADGLFNRIGRAFRRAAKPPASGPDPLTHFTDVIPMRLQLALHQAQLAGKIPDQRKAIADEQAFLKTQLRRARTNAQRDDIVQQLLEKKSELDALDSTQTRARRRSQTLQQRRDAAGFRSLESRLRAREDRAAAADLRTSRRTGVTTHAGEARALRREETELKAFMRDHSHALKLRQEANSRLAAVEKHLAKIEKNTSQNVFAKQAQAFLETLSGEIRREAPNIEQHFHSDRPAEDPHAAGRQQRKAAAAAFS